MELHPIQEAQSLRGPVSLGDLIAMIREEQSLFHDHPEIGLRDTYLEEDGLWRYNGSAARLTRHSLGQVCSRVRLPDGGSVPAGYLARCPAPLAAENLNHWIERMPVGESPRVMVRCRHDGVAPEVARAVLSDRYAVADHLELLTSLREMLPGQRLGLSAWSLDDVQMTLRLMVDRDHPASLDDPIRVGLHISNSEVGLGRISVHGLITRLVCSNGLVVHLADLGSVHRRHVGKAGESLKEVIHEGLTRVMVEVHEAASRFVRLREEPVPEPMEAFLEKTAKQANLPEALARKAWELAEGETVYDAINAFTLAAQSLKVADRVEAEAAMSRFLAREV